MNTCKDCIHAQADLSSIKYIRIANITDIMIVACPKHLKGIENVSIPMKYETLDELRENSK